MRYLLNNIQNDCILFEVGSQMEFFIIITEYLPRSRSRYINSQVFGLFNSMCLDQPHNSITKLSIFFTFLNIN
jgi:hypothetical protein